MRRITCIAIDDEPLALLVISQFCARKGGLDLTTFSEPRLGLAEIVRRKPDLVFLDIEMNGISGLDVAHALPPGCCLIFTTAHARYALAGFDLDAVDFLHKPFAYERFERAVDRALRRIGERQEHTNEHIIVKQEYANVQIPLGEILYAEAMENYVKIIRERGDYVLTLASLKEIGEMLPEGRFIRIHRSYIVAAEKIERFSRREIRLKGVSQPLPVGRQYAEELYRVLKSE